MFSFFLTRHDSDVMCPGNDILVFLLNLMVVALTKAWNTPWKCVVLTRSRVVALWRYFKPQSMLKMHAPGDLGYVSDDGHHFSCENLIMILQDFHEVCLYTTD